jgi:hypothetical protein
MDSKTSGYLPRFTRKEEFMKRVSMSFICLLSVFTVLFFGGCENNQETEEDQGTEGTITVTVKEDEKFYYSLVTGKEVSGDAINTPDWDIGFQRPRTILTNSGTTAAALKSGGDGHVWYTETIDFDGAAEGDAVKEGDLREYFVDASRWLYSMSTKQNMTYNVINFAGYNTGSGTEQDPFKTLLYDQKQFYEGKGSSNYPVTNVVYIVRHGDGVHFSKIQVSNYEYANKSDTYVIKYKTF